MDLIQAIAADKKLLSTDRWILATALRSCDYLDEWTDTLKWLTTARLRGYLRLHYDLGDTMHWGYDYNTQILIQEERIKRDRLLNKTLDHFSCHLRLAWNVVKYQFGYDLEHEMEISKGSED